MAVKVKAWELRTKSSKELLSQLDTYKKELSELRVAKATGAASTKLAKIKGVRKAIAKINTVYNQNNKAAARAVYKGKKYIPRDLRPKKTRAIRRALTKKQQNAVSLKVLKQKQNFPQRRFAVRA